MNATYHVFFVSALTKQRLLKAHWGYSVVKFESRHNVLPLHRNLNEYMLKVIEAHRHQQQKGNMS
jgi:hypothetical protein